VRKIEWTPDGIDSFNEILEYYRDRAGENISNAIYDKIIKEIELLEKVYILFVLDGRRNLEEILMSKVIDNKI